MTVNAKELTRQAIHFQNPPRPPLLFRNDQTRSDVVQVGYYAPINYVNPEKTLDEWGCEWENAIGTGLGYIQRHPLADWKDFDSYIFPDPRLTSRFIDIERAVQKYPDRYIAVGVGLTGFGGMTALRGFENILTDFYLEPERLNQLADRMFAFENAAVEEIGKRGVDAVWFFDDWGTERGLFINPNLWRQFFKERYANQFRLAHDLGMEVFFHSCGYVWSILPDLIECGVDVFNLEQMRLFSDETRTGYQRIVDEFGGKVSFTVNVDTQRTLVTGTAQEIAEEIDHIFAVFGRLPGGWIVFTDAGKDHNIHPVENLRLIEKLFVEKTLSFQPPER